MDFADGATIKGAVTITLRDVETGDVDVWHGPNAITNVGLELFHQCLQGIAGASPIAYLAIGSGTGAFPGGATAMYNEYYRRAITTMSVAVNVATYRVYFTTAMASGIIRELGLTNAAGSGAGVLIGHIQVSPQKTKSSAKEMIVAISHTLSRA